MRMNKEYVYRKWKHIVIESTYKLARGEHEINHNEIQNNGNDMHK